MTCREVADFMMDYVTGDLPFAARRRFEFHLLTCRNCRRYLATYQATMSIGRAAIERLDADAAEEVPEDLIQAILDSRTLPPSS